MRRGEHRLADHVAGPCGRPCGFQVLALQVDLRAAHLLAGARRVVDRRGPADEMLQLVVEFGEEFRVVLEARIGIAQFVDRVGERLARESAAVRAEMAGVASGLLIGGVHGFTASMGGQPTPTCCGARTTLELGGEGVGGTYGRHEFADLAGVLDALGGFHAGDSRQRPASCNAVAAPGCHRRRWQATTHQTRRGERLRRVEGVTNRMPCRRRRIRRHEHRAGWPGRSEKSCRVFYEVEVRSGRAERNARRAQVTGNAPMRGAFVALRGRFVAVELGDGAGYGGQGAGRRCLAFIDEKQYRRDEGRQARGERCRAFGGHGARAFRVEHEADGICARFD